MVQSFGWQPRQMGCARVSVLELRRGSAARLSRPRTGTAGLAARSKYHPSTHQAAWGLGALKARFKCPGCGAQGAASR